MLNSNTGARGGHGGKSLNSCVVKALVSRPLTCCLPSSHSLSVGFLGLIFHFLPPPKENVIL